MQSKQLHMAAVATALFLALAGVMFEESFVHTDDGCPVEVHCLACRLSVGTAAVAATVGPIPSAMLARAECLEAHAEHARNDPAPDPSSSRGPPRA